MKGSAHVTQMVVIQLDTFTAQEIEWALQRLGMTEVTNPEMSKRVHTILENFRQAPRISAKEEARAE